MQQVAAWLVGARHRAILLAAALFMVPLMMPLAAALMALVTLHHGPREGAIAASGAAAVLAGVAMLTGGPAAALFASALLLLLAVVGVSALMAATASMSLAFQATVLVTAVLAAGLGALWQGSGMSEQLTAEFLELAQTTGAADGEAQSLAAAMADVLFGMAFGGVLISVMLALMLGSWLAGWAQERAILGPQFHGLSAGRAVTMIATAVLAATWLLGGGWALDAAVVFLAAFLLQGLAVVHAQVARREGHPLWLAAVYSLLLVPTPLAPLAGMSLTAVGYLDNWLGLRGTGQATPPEQRS